MTNNPTLPLDEGIEIIRVSKEDALAKRNAYLQREKDFLNYWKKGVEIAGYHYFGDGTKENFEQATDKNQLSPVSAKMEAAFGALGHGEAMFLAAMYSFYNDHKGGELCRSLNANSVGALTLLDGNRRAVIAGLLVTYCGW